MSKRRKIGDVICKKMKVGSALVFRGRIAKGAPKPCTQCDDSECVVWPNIEALNMMGSVIGITHDVSECQMEDDETMKGVQK